MKLCCFTGGESWTKDQKWVLATLLMTHMCNGMVVSLQAPFYPAAAEAKGADATQYGLVFGIFELTVFIVSPLVGRFLYKIGVNRAFSGGLLTTGSMCVAFGMLNFFQNANTFIALSCVVRVVEALGNSAFLTSSFSLVAQLFPSSVGTVFSIVEMSFGFGMILGPTFGGLLYQYGGFVLPFLTLGIMLLIQALLSVKSLPPMSREGCEPQEGMGVLRALTIPSVLLAAFSVFSASLAVGALQTTLERHLARFGLNPLEVGVFFMMYGTAYAVLNPLWGWISDKLTPRIVIVAGSLFVSLGFLLAGPVPWFNLPPNYYLTLAAVILIAAGLGAQFVSAFAEAQKSAVREGFPDDLTTYSMVSSLWTSSFALGAFVGPMAAGALYDRVGFEWSTLFTVGWNSAVLVAALVSLLASPISTRWRREERRSLYRKLESDYGSTQTSEVVLVREIEANRSKDLSQGL